MGRTEFYVIAFENTHSAMQAQKLLKPHYSITVIPTLREVSQSCGISVMLPEMEESQAVAAAQSLGLASGLYQLYHVQGDKGSRVITPIAT